MQRANALRRWAATMTEDHLDDMFAGLPDNLSISDVVALFAPVLTRRAIEQLVRNGTIPAYKVGRKWIIRRDDLKDFMRRNANSPDPP